MDAEGWLGVRVSVAYLHVATVEYVQVPWPGQMTVQPPEMVGGIPGSRLSEQLNWQPLMVSDPEWTSVSHTLLSTAICAVHVSSTDPAGQSESVTL